jgi:hypothetical protein
MCAGFFGLLEGVVQRYYRNVIVIGREKWASLTLLGIVIQNKNCLCIESQNITHCITNERRMDDKFAIVVRDSRVQAVHVA